MNGLPDKANLRPEEVAEFLDVSRSTVYSWAKEGKVFDRDKIIKMPNGSIRFPREEVLRAIEKLQNMPFKDEENGLPEQTAKKKVRRTISKGVE